MVLNSTLSYVVVSFCSDCVVLCLDLAGVQERTFGWMLSLGYALSCLSRGRMHTLLPATGVLLPISTKS